MQTGCSVQSSTTVPASLVERIREMAAKRERQASAATNELTARELQAAAKGYRALADALAKKPDGTASESITPAEEVAEVLPAGHEKVIEAVQPYNKIVDVAKPAERVADAPRSREGTAGATASVAAWAERL